MVFAWLSVVLVLSQDLPSDAVSIRPSTEKRRQVAGRNFIGITLKETIAELFDYDVLNVVTPDWMDKERYDIDGKRVERWQDRRDAIRRVLEEKFSLVVQEEKRPKDVWVLSTPQGKTPQLRPAEQPIWKQGCNGQQGSFRLRMYGACDLRFAKFAVERLLGEPVIDETELTGFYNFDVIWDKNDPGATQRSWWDQLGVQVARETRMVDVLVVVSAVKPPEVVAEEEARRWPCEASPAVRAALEALPAGEQRWDPLRKLAGDYPFDPFVQARFQDALRERKDPGEWDAALARYRAVNDAILGPFLEGRLLLDADAVQSERLLLETVRRAPQFPWAHLALVEWMETDGRRDVGRAETHMREFRRLCPASLAAFRHYRNIEYAEMLREADRALRGVLARRVDPEAASMWPVAWDLLLRITPPERLPVVRQQIRADLMRLRFLNQVDRPEWVAAMRYGYRLIEDAAGLESLEALLRRTE